VNLWLIAGPAAAGLGLTAYGAAYPRAQLFVPAVCYTGSSRQLAITFDDGPNPSVTPKLLDLLDRYEAQATFFLIGRYAHECPHLVREIAARGHAIGNHTQTHRNLLFLSPIQIREEIRHCQDGIARAGVAPPKWFRPPWGVRNPALAGITNFFDVRVAMWSLIPGDWRAKTDDWLIGRIEPIANRARDAAAHPGRGDILCLHDGSHRGQNFDRSHTLAALEYWLPRWRELGLEFVTIEQAVHTPA
jgi:peptidoglycan-N-acetylglucosamine deacetylase